MTKELKKEAARRKKEEADRLRDEKKQKRKAMTLASQALGKLEPLLALVQAELGNQKTKDVPKVVLDKATRATTGLQSILEAATNCLRSGGAVMTFTMDMVRTIAAQATEAMKQLKVFIALLEKA